MTGPDDLPILAELEEAFAALVRAELREEPRGVTAARERPSPQPTPRASAPRQRRHRPEREPRASRLPFPTGRRILARALAAGALAGVVGATALATKSVVGHDDGNWSAPRTLQHAGGHEVALRRYHGRWCLDVTYAGGVASRCAATPAGDGVAPLSAVVPRGRVVVGLVGAEVERVTVRRSGHAVTVATHAVGGSELRWFAATLDGVRHEARHAAVVAPSPTGRAVADCTLGTAASCRAAREHSEVRM